jgi:hypothetical protein
MAAPSWAVAISARDRSNSKSADFVNFLIIVLIF